MIIACFYGPLVHGAGPGWMALLVPPRVLLLKVVIDESGWRWWRSFSGALRR